jgi:uncharacterized membrane protein YdbT with pleckstrin-like domain
MDAAPGMQATTEVGTAPVPAVRTGCTDVPEGELVILRLRPHPLFIVLAVLGPLAASVVSAWVLWWVSGRSFHFVGNAVLEVPSLGRWWMAPAGVALLALGWQVLEWWCRGYLLTDRRVVRVSGVLRQTVVEVPLARVQQVMMYRSVRERVCGLGTPGVSSAGSGGASYLFWNMVSRPEERMRIVRETVARYAGNGHGGAHE